MRPRRWTSREAAAVCVAAGLLDAELAMRRLAERQIDLAGFTEPPFDPEVLASMRNVRDVHRVPMNGAARLIPDGAYLRIEVNQEHSQGKQNFSIDHEVSHTLIPTYANQRVDDAETGIFGDASEEELLCDIGAAGLLLDRRWLARFAYQAAPSLALLGETAATFAASLEATARQLAAVAPWPAAFVFWEDGLRKQERERILPSQLALPEFAGLAGPQPKLRIMRRYRTQTFPHFLPPNKSVPDASLVAGCGDDEPQTAGVETFELEHGAEPIELYCENMHAPYRRGKEIRRRVISLLLPVDQQTGTPESFTPYEWEAL